LRSRDAAHDAVVGALHHLHRHAALARFVAHCKFGHEIGQRVRIEQRLHQLAACFDQAADPVGKIVGQAIGLQGVCHHGQHPLSEVGPGFMQPVVDGRQRQSEEGGYVLMRTFMDEEQRGRFAQSVRQF
jgi:hypothetical protein